jgi:hypothetical protein
MPPVGFEPTIPASARPQTYPVDRAVTGIGYVLISLVTDLQFMGVEIVCCELRGRETRTYSRIRWRANPLQNHNKTINF